MNRKQARRAAIRTPTLPQDRKARERYLERNGITVEYLTDETAKARQEGQIEAAKLIYAAAMAAYAEHISTDKDKIAAFIRAVDEKVCAGLLDWEAIDKLYAESGISIKWDEAFERVEQDGEV